MEQINDTTPDELMEDFRGRSLKSIIIFTVVVHIVIILATSIPFIISKAGSSDDLSDEDRMKLAVKDSILALQEIADEYGVSREELSDRLSGDSKPAPTSSDTEESDGPTTPPEEEVSDDPKSPIEEEINVVKPGPTVPPVDEEEDLFK